MRHRSAKLSALLLCILLACSVLGGCAQAEPQKYSTLFFDVFDTVTTIIGYADSQETFDRVVGEARQQFVRYHQVFDGYNAYEGVHNLYYVNQNAASGPVPAEPELMTLLAWIRDLQPSLEGTSTPPGTANTSLPCSSASSAVISEPDFMGASATTTPRLRPLMIRLRRGKKDGWPALPGGYSLTAAP